MIDDVKDSDATSKRISSNKTRIKTVDHNHQNYLFRLVKE